MYVSNSKTSKIHWALALFSKSNRIGVLFTHTYDDTPILQPHIRPILAHSSSP